MKTYNSNSNNALIKDLGPFKLQSADNSMNGKKVWEYKPVSTPKNVGTQTTYGKSQKSGSTVTTTFKDS
jgi:hypothetical protein